LLGKGTSHFSLPVIPGAAALAEPFGRARESSIPGKDWMPGLGCAAPGTTTERAALA